MDFHVGIPTSVSSVIGSEDAFIEPHAYQSTPLLLFGFGIPLLELSRQDNGESGAGAGRRRGIEDANRGIDDPATQVGQILQCNHGQSGIGQCGRTARAGTLEGLGAGNEAMRSRPAASMSGSATGSRCSTHGSSRRRRSGLSGRRPIGSYASAGGSSLREVIGWRSRPGSKRPGRSWRTTRRGPSTGWPCGSGRGGRTAILGSSAS